VSAPGHGQTPVDVLVVGAGPVGLTSAAALMNNGARVRIIDRLETWSSLSKAMTLTPRTLECYRMIGVADRCREEGILSRRIHHYTERGRKIAVTRLDEADCEFPGLLHLSQSKNIEALVGALAARGVQVERSSAFLELEGTTGRYRSRVGRSDGSVEVIESRFVVGADGSNSRVRGTVGAAFVGEEQTETFIMADIVMKGFPHDPEDRHVFYVEGTFLTILPIDGTHFRLISTCRVPAQGVDEAFVLRRLQVLLRAVGLGRVALGDPFWVTRFNPRQYVVDRFRHEGVFLVGDAAHIQSPIGAQGLNTGIQDAINLAWKLGLVLRGGAGDALLDSYHRERHPVAQRLFQYNNRISERVFGRSWLKRRALRYENYLLQLPSFHADEVAKISQLHIDYAGCGLVIDGGAEPHRGRSPRGLRPGVRPGMRMPPCALLDEDGARFDLLEALAARTHVLLAFGGDGPAASSWCLALRDRVAALFPAGAVRTLQVSERVSPRQRYLKEPGDDVLYDPSGRWRRAARLHAPCAILVRPDGCVATVFGAGGEGRLTAYHGCLTAWRAPMLARRDP
jgi:2-polyprenyl-6-methoxyphenol hydroxylase-like FAD-dependent oxidoreductase